MKSLKITSTSNQLEKNNIAQQLIRDNLYKDLLKKHLLLGIGENTMVFHLLKIKENAEVAGHSLLLEV